jgi:hypothetical protein
MLQLRKKQFDKAAELHAARAVYIKKMSAKQALNYLQIVANYGDISDVEPLECLSKVSPYSSVRNLASELLNTLFSL